MSNIFKKFIVEDICDYIKAIEEISKENDVVWFRGQEDSSYRLIPKALRETVAIEDQFGRKIDRKTIRANTNGDIHEYINVHRMLAEFKRRAIPMINNKPDNDLEWMFLAQHYGLPTLLLDWTTNPLVSLYFALTEKALKNYSKDEFDENDEFSSYAAAVFAINPNTVNSIFQNLDKPIYPYEYFSSKIFHDSPICILGNHIDSRIRMQSGNFTLHGSNIWAIDYYTIMQQKIYKIFIPYKFTNKIKNQLDILGIDETFIYNDLSSLCKDINKSEYKNFCNSIDKYS